jgi:glycerol-3-phosphate acyltransferase PlsY
MIEALADGTIDIIVSSHDPQDVDTKRLPLRRCRRMERSDWKRCCRRRLALHHSGDVPLIRLIDALSTRPAAIFGLEAGTLRPGVHRRSRASSTSTNRGRLKGRNRLHVEEHALRGCALSRGASFKPWLQAERSSPHNSIAPSTAPPEFVSDARPDHQRDRPARGMLAALRFRLPSRVDPLRPAADPLAGLGDVRSIGSGNIGATNVLRTGNKKLAAATLLLDALKGTAAVLIAGTIRSAGGADRRPGGLPRPPLPRLARLQGRQGCRDLCRRAARSRARHGRRLRRVWIAVAYLTRYSSLSALVATIVVPVCFVLMGNRAVAELFAVLGVITWQTRANIKPGSWRERKAASGRRARWTRRCDGDPSTDRQSASPGCGSSAATMSGRHHLPRPHQPLRIGGRCNRSAAGTGTSRRRLRKGADRKRCGSGARAGTCCAIRSRICRHRRAGLSPACCARSAERRRFSPSKARWTSPLARLSPSSALAMPRPQAPS